MLIFLPLKLSKSMKDRWQNVNRVYWPENLFCQIKLSKESDSLERIVYIMFFENWSNIYPQTRRERLVYMHRCRREQCAMQASAWSCVLQQQQQQRSRLCPVTKAAPKQSPTQMVPQMWGWQPSSSFDLSLWIPRLSICVGWERRQLRVHIRRAPRKQAARAKLSRHPTSQQRKQHWVSVLWMKRCRCSPLRQEFKERFHLKLPGPYDHCLVNCQHLKNDPKPPDTSNRMRFG